jgi:hypothetical protein
VPHILIYQSLIHTPEEPAIPLEVRQLQAAMKAMTNHWSQKFAIIRGSLNISGENRTSVDLARAFASWSNQLL